MLRIAPSEPRKRLYPEPRATNFARGSLASRFPCPWFGSNISGRPAKSERARDSGSALVDPGIPRPVDIKPGSSADCSTIAGRGRGVRGGLA